MTVSTFKKRNNNRPQSTKKVVSVGSENVNQATELLEFSPVEKEAELEWTFQACELMKNAVSGTSPL